MVKGDFPAESNVEDSAYKKRRVWYIITFKK